MLYGIDIGGTKIELAIFDEQLNLVTSWRTPTPTKDYQQLLLTIEKMVAQADEKTRQQGSIGIGFPGIIDKHGCAVSANIHCINGQSIVKDTLKILARPVGFENDVKAFILSEINNGAATGKRNALGVVLGTGIAGGLCIDGQLYCSKQSVACEFGHVPLPAILQQRYQFPLRQCGCGLVGCVEQYLAGPGLLWMCSHFEAQYASVPALIQGVQAHEPKALEVMNSYIDCLACFFAQLTLMYDPDIIVLGGGLCNIAEIYPLLPAAMKHYLFAGVIPPDVVPAVFGDASGVRGAAILGQQATLKSNNYKAN